MQLNIHPRTIFEAPSGQQFNDRDLILIRWLAQNKSIEWTDREVTFNSGFTCNVYVRMRSDLTHNVPLLRSVGERIKSFVLGLRHTHGLKPCLIGIPTAGSPLAQAAALLSFDPHRELEARICSRQLRTELKDGHGKTEDTMWAGPPELEHFSPITVENIISTAKAYLKHLNHLEEDGYPTKEMHHIAFGNWELGGAEALYDAGYQKGYSIYRVRDMIAALVYLNDWPREYYEETDRRVRLWRREKKLGSAA